MKRARLFAGTPKLFLSGRDRSRPVRFENNELHDIADMSRPCPYDNNCPLIVSSKTERAALAPSPMAMTICL